jgi:hypothetical protein
MFTSQAHVDPANLSFNNASNGVVISQAHKLSEKNLAINGFSAN